MHVKQKHDNSERHSPSLLPTYDDDWGPALLSSLMPRGLFPLNFPSLPISLLIRSTRRDFLLRLRGVEQVG